MAEIVVLHFIISNRFVSLFSLKSTLQYETKGQIKTHSKNKRTATKISLQYQNGKKKRNVDRKRDKDILILRKL